MFPNIMKTTIFGVVLTICTTRYGGNASGMVSAMKDSTRWKNDSWWVSPYNFIEETSVEFPKDIEFEDITLRDGEQQAGVVLRKEDKMEIALKLAEIGVERI